MEEQNNGERSEQEVYPLDDALISILTDIAKAQTQLEQQAQALHAQRTGALVLYVRQHKLQGNWRLAENGHELVKDPAPAAKETP